MVGHLFQGRYKALVIDPESPDHFQAVSDYIHLNPARAGVLDRVNPKLADYRWSSFPYFILSVRKESEWLYPDRVFSCLGLGDDSADVRRKYRTYLERRAAGIVLGEELDEEEELERKAVRTEPVCVVCVCCLT